MNVTVPSLLRSPLRSAISALTRAPEPELLPGLIALARLDARGAASAEALALRIARGVRDRVSDSGRAGLVQNLLQEFALSSQEGVALMCLAEALLRIPDADTRDALIRDKIGAGNWQAHLGNSPSLFVNAASWGLLLTGKLVATHSDAGLSTALRRIVARSGEPLVRRGVDMAMRMMGEQFVTGETIEQALDNAREREALGFRFSYDMLGEAAMTETAARHYLAAYEHAIETIGAASKGRGIYEGPGISIKLSALHPRYSRAQLARVNGELYPRLLKLALRARAHDIGLNIDAEESERLELSLDLLERLCLEPALAGWNGVGFVIQAYQKRCPAVVDYLIDLARRSRRRLMIRLVKGAYWDSEIKRAQIDGLDDYPVYTRKVHTDVAYVACARQLLAAPDAIYPQFATHNAQTLATIVELAGPNYYAGQYEFQCLHGMGEPLYEQIVTATHLPQPRPCRIYAPVGTHDTLLAYLVRRLLENGANTSFVNRIADEDVPLEALVHDPIVTIEAAAASEGRLGLPHPAIVLPSQLYGVARLNSRGLDLASEAAILALDQVLSEAPSVVGHPQDEGRRGESQQFESLDAESPHFESPRDASLHDVDQALARAELAAKHWAGTAAAARAALLESAAARMERGRDELIHLLVFEGRKTRANAVSELREAVDFLRYYAMLVRDQFEADTYRPLGAVACISPWNFPLAIFTGQIAAALAAGNVVLAKPAEQTPRVAQAALRLMLDAGLPANVLQLLPGPGETVGAALVADRRIQGVVFTGSTEVAQLLQRSLANRLNTDGQPVPLIAETGGQNAMIVDSSALIEQVVTDVLTSAFDSAGQRCSALRVLCVQQEIAPRLIDMLTEAMRELRIGDPRELATDVGPVIDRAAKQAIDRHIAAMRSSGCKVVSPTSIASSRLAAETLAESSVAGHFVAPTLIEIDSIADLRSEVFGPVLHVLRFQREHLADLLEDINASQYGLTLGVHSRIDETVAQVVAAANVGNIYVNRNIVGAVVGTQPFGGEGLSGTGPKAGGPLYLLRLLASRPADAANRIVARFSAEAEAKATPRLAMVRAQRDGRDLQQFRDWAAGSGLIELAAFCDAAEALSPLTGWRELPGPTGESNLYAIRPRGKVLCLADSDGDRWIQLAAVLAVGATALWPAHTKAVHDRLPSALRGRVVLVQDWTQPYVEVAAVLFHGSSEALLALGKRLAQRPGPLVSITACKPGQIEIALERLVIERSLSINTAAAGGNASLMTIG